MVLIEPKSLEYHEFSYLEQAFSGTDAAMLFKWSHDKSRAKIFCAEVLKQDGGCTSVVDFE